MDTYLTTTTHKLHSADCISRIGGFLIKDAFTMIFTAVPDARKCPIICLDSVQERSTELRSITHEMTPSRSFLEWILRRVTGFLLVVVGGGGARPPPPAAWFLEQKNPAWDRVKWVNFRNKNLIFHRRVPPPTVSYHTQSWCMFLNHIFRHNSKFFCYFHEECPKWSLLWKAPQNSKFFFLYPWIVYFMQSVLEIWSWYSAWWRAGDNFRFAIFFVLQRP